MEVSVEYITWECKQAEYGTSYEREQTKLKNPLPTRELRRLLSGAYGVSPEILHPPWRGRVSWNTYLKGYELIGPTLHRLTFKGYEIPHDAAHRFYWRFIWSASNNFG